MRALLCKEFGPLDRLAVETVDDPVPGKREILIDVKAAGINYPDLLVVQGKYQAQPPLPFIAGGEAAGIVAAVGEEVEQIRPGDPVIGMDLHGAFAEKMVVPERSAVPIPMGMDFKTAAGISVTYATSYHALKQRARIQPGETLVVLGAAGGVGMTAVELGKVLGARVIAAASSEAKLDAACAAGADERVNYSEEPLKDRIKELTGGQGADVVYDPVGGDYAEQALRAMAWDGRFLVVGFATGDIPKIPLNLPLLKGVHIVGVWWGTWSQREPSASDQNFNELRKMFEEGRLKPRITPYPLDGFLEAFRELDERRAQGKVVLVME